MNGDDDQTQAQPNDAADELARLRSIAQDFGPLAHISEALKNDPSKIYALNAAINGVPIPQPQGQPQHQEVTPQLSKEQIDALNLEAMQNPAMFAARMGQIAAQNQMAQFERNASPYMNTTADLFIENFKNRKAGEDTMYKQTIGAFERELSDVNRQELLRADQGQRARMLELRWQAAQAQVFRAAALKREREAPPDLGRGANQGETQKANVFDKDPTVAGLVASFKGKGMLSDEDLTELLADIQKENE